MKVLCYDSGGILLKVSIQDITDTEIEKDVSWEISCIYYFVFHLLVLEGFWNARN